MKRVYFVISTLIIVLFYACNSGSKFPKENTSAVASLYEIKGTVLGKESALVILSDSAGHVIQQAVVKDNSFVLSGKPKNNIVFLHFEKQEKTPLFLDTLFYEARIWDNNPNRFLVTSTHPKQIAYNSYQKELSNIDRQLFLLSPSLYDVDKLKKKEFLMQSSTLKEKRDALTAHFIEDNKHSFVSLFELKRALPLLGAERASLLFSKIDSVLCNQSNGIEIATALGAILKESKKKNKSIVAEATKKTPVTSPKAKKPERFPAPSFNGLSPEGHLVDLLTIVRQNKIVMLDFWGTWCEPCRMQNPFWTRLYKKYHSKGFEIISIAEEKEDSRPFLEAAIEQDNMNWIHVVDENYKIAELYGAYSLPHAVLVDHEGKIIYHKATARDVQEYLQEYFSKQ